MSADGTDLDAMRVEVATLRSSLCALQEQLDAERARADAAEARVVEESATLLSVVTNLQDLNISLQRKWEAARDSATPSAATPDGPDRAAERSRSVSEEEAVRQQKEREHLAEDVETASLDARACGGVLHVIIEGWSAAPTEASRAEATFVELSFEGCTARSHARPAGGAGGSQPFSLPVARRALAPGASATHGSGGGTLVATLCEADGGGGGGALGSSIVLSVADLVPFTPTARTCTLRALPAGAPYRGSAPRAMEEAIAAAATAAATAAAAAAVADDVDGAGGATAAVATLRLRLEWRPYDVSSEPLDGLGFPLARRKPKRGAPPAPMSTSASEASAISIGGEWWEADALCLARWNAVLCSVSSLDELPRARLEKLLAAGVPMQHRMHVWTYCAGRLGAGAGNADANANENGQGNAHEFAAGDESAADVDDKSAAVAAAADPAAARVINADLLRTFPTHPFLSHAHSPLVEPLRRVLLANCAALPSVGYCQGLNFVAALLLMHGDESDATSLLRRFCASLLPEFHTPDMRGLHAAQTALMSSLGILVPRLVSRLSAERVPLREQTTHWLLCAYLDALPLDASLRVWDVLFLGGKAVLLSVAAAAFTIHEERLLRAAGEIYDLSTVLRCDTHALLTTSRTSQVRVAVDAALVAEEGKGESSQYV